MNGTKARPKHLLKKFLSPLFLLLVVSMDTTGDCFDVLLIVGKDMRMDIQPVKPLYL